MYKQSLIAKIGNDKDSPEIRTGQYKDDEMNVLKMSIVQLPRDSHVKKILFKKIDCKVKTCLSTEVIYTKFTLLFLDKDLKVIGCSKNVGEFVDLSQIKRDKNIQVKFVDSNVAKKVIGLGFVPFLDQRIKVKEFFKKP